MTGGLLGPRARAAAEKFSIFKMTFLQSPETPATGQVTQGPKQVTWALAITGDSE